MADTDDRPAARDRALAALDSAVYFLDRGLAAPQKVRAFRNARAVIGALAISGLDSVLGNAEDGIGVGFRLDLPEGSRLVILGALMALMLILRPSGITGGRELRLPRRRTA